MENRIMAVLKRGEVCPMPYAQFPIPHSQIVLPLFVKGNGDYKCSA
jgi:hypothetical protein